MDQINKIISEIGKKNLIVQNRENLNLEINKVVLLGMGGSHMGADIYNSFAMHGIDIIKGYIKEYPSLLEENALFILSSFSGNTEEIVSSYKILLEKGKNLAVISNGGELLEMAKKNNTPYVFLESTGMQPRYTSLISAMSIAKILGNEEFVNTLSNSSLGFDIKATKFTGDNLSDKLYGHIPVFYSSNKNKFVSEFFKIFLNETVKIPAFSNTLSEMNHNEMQSYQKSENHKLGKDIAVVLVKDESDIVEVKKRFSALEEVLKEQGVKVISLDITSDSRMTSVLKGFALPILLASTLGERYGAELFEVPMIEDFKKRLRK